METVLIVDDDAGIVRLVAAVLRNSGYAVLEAADGLEALQLAARHPAPIDLLLSDVQLPGLRGPELCRRVRKQHPETRYLLMSGRVEGLEGLGLALLAKPFRISDLLRSIRSVLDTSPGQPAEPARRARPPSFSSSSRR